MSTLLPDAKERRRAAKAPRPFVLPETHRSYRMLHKIMHNCSLNLVFKCHFTYLIDLRSPSGAPYRYDEMYRVPGDYLAVAVREFYKAIFQAYRETLPCSSWVLALLDYRSYEGKYYNPTSSIIRERASSLPAAQELLLDQIVLSVARKQEKRHTRGHYTESDREKEFAYALRNYSDEEEVAAWLEVLDDGVLFWMDSLLSEKEKEWMEGSVLLLIHTTATWLAKYSKWSEVNPIRRREELLSIISELNGDVSKHIDRISLQTFHLSK